MSDPLVFTVSKADPTGKEPTVGAVLNITSDLQQVKGVHPHQVWRALTINQHVQDAQQVAAALAHLPQGTVDQVLVLLLQQRASLLRIPGEWPAAPGIKDLPPSPPPEFVQAVGTVLEEAKTFRPSLPPVTKENASEALWVALRALLRELEEQRP